MALYSCRKVVAVPPKWWVAAEEPELEVIEVKALSKCTLCRRTLWWISPPAACCGPSLGLGFRV